MLAWTTGLLGLAFQINSQEVCSKILLEGLSCEWPLLHACRLDFVDHKGVGDHNIHQILEQSGAPPLGFMVDRICPNHLVRGVDATHVLVLLCDCCGSGDGDLLFCPILNLLPAQHCLPTVHRVDGGAQGNLSSIHPFDKQKIPVPDPPYAASQGSFSEGILLRSGDSDPSLPVDPTGSEPLLAQVCEEERTSVKIVCIDNVPRS